VNLAANFKKVIGVDESAAQLSAATVHGALLLRRERPVTSRASPARV
jgi:hypothetical protein